MRHMGADIDRARQAFELVKIFGKVSQFQVMPSASAVPGMSSTPSIKPISQSCRSGFVGAKPTPQLPITTVVTPCQLEGAISWSQVAWPS